jgi:hypothetical protein
MPYYSVYTVFECVSSANGQLMYYCMKLRDLSIHFKFNNSPL